MSFEAGTRRIAFGTGARIFCSFITELEGTNRLLAETCSSPGMASGRRRYLRKSRTGGAPTSPHSKENPKGNETGNSAAEIKQYGTGWSAFFVLPKVQVLLFACDRLNGLGAVMLVQIY